MDRIDPALLTMFAELDERTAQAALVEGLPLDGSFYRHEVKGRRYWYHRAYDRAAGKPVARYVGPSEPKLDARIERYRELAPMRTERRRMVTLLKRAGFPAPDAYTGDIIAALAEAGLFRLRAVLVGTAAYPAYAALLGARLPSANMMTQDVDVAQFHGIALAVGDVSAPIQESLARVDKSFRPVPTLKSPLDCFAYVDARGFRVEFLTPHQGSDDQAATLTRLPDLDGPKGQPLRFLDFLIYQEMPTTLLHGPGVRVNVPAPERFTVHKLIIAARRSGAGRLKAAKDLAQAGALIEAHAASRQMDVLHETLEEARARGPAWREALDRSFGRLPPPIRALLP
ncbi:nucleotidyltransferase family protein [Geminicoccus harenae]|uniref:nucleotidyltransferase family protein n=1 Tax=Geminicoccus harenae TaxID=2498453 RepID=UPI00168B7834|nr:GSU2403 family nucleotidyltransferase fold protein [Geminicoccus harenae]